MVCRRTLSLSTYQASYRQMLGRVVNNELEKFKEKGCALTVIYCSHYDFHYVVCQKDR